MRSSAISSYSSRAEPSRAKPLLQHRSFPSSHFVHSLMLAHRAAPALAASLGGIMALFLLRTCGLLFVVTPSEEGSSCPPLLLSPSSSGTKPRGPVPAQRAKPFCPCPCPNPCVWECPYPPPCDCPRLAEDLLPDGAEAALALALALVPPLKVALSRSGSIAGSERGVEMGEVEFGDGPGTEWLPFPLTFSVVAVPPPPPRRNVRLRVADGRTGSFELLNCIAIE